MKLGVRTFPSKAAAKEFLRGILHRAVPDEIISDAEIIEVCAAIARMSGTWSCECCLGLRNSTGRWSGMITVSPDPGNKHPHFQFVMSDGTYRQLGCMSTIDKPDFVTWCPQLHQLWPKPYREALKTFVLCSSRFSVRLPGAIIELIGAALVKQLELQ